MKRLFILLTMLVSSVGINAQEPKFPFNDPSLSVDQRVEDLLDRLTLEEKVGMMMNGSTGIERLGIPDYNWWNEALHGVARAGVATVFPQAIGMAATFDPEEHLRTFTVISDEARAKYNQAIREGQHKQYYGLSFWTPNINIFRDPRWGRGQETYGEDPYLTSIMGTAAVFGLQGDDDTYFKSHACAKHFAVHSGPESMRHSFDATASPRDLWETYLPAFDALVTEANVQEVMGAYNRYNGKPCCSSDFLLMDILRNRWNFQGMVVSDCGAITDFFAPNAHNTHKDAPSASADAVKTGTDVECGSNYQTLIAAVENGYITEDEIDVSMRRIIKGWIDLGILDSKDNTPWADLPYSIVASDAHAQQALTVARKSMVLLKNDKNVLPLKPEKIKKIAVLGPNAADSTMMLGNYNGDPTHVVTILDGIKAAYPDAEVTYERGCDLVEGFISVPKAPRTGMDMAELARQMGLKAIPSENYSDEALKALADRAAQADVIIFVGGISPAVEGEELKTTVDGFAGGDRERIELPEVQSKVLKALHKTGKPVVFVLCTGSAIALEQNEKDYDALICAWYGGQEGGRAVADVISGKYNPSGRLPLTFYKSTSQLPDFLDYSMDGRTYRYFRGVPQYAFGYGLSYTTFEVGKGKISKKSMPVDGEVTVTVPVKNTGKREGTETIQVYVKALDYADASIKDLKGFAKLNLKPGQKGKVEIVLNGESFQYYDPSIDELSTKPGRYQILYGTSSLDKDLQTIDFEVK